MSLISRKQKPTAGDRVLAVVRYGVQALVAQRVARKAYKGYKWTRRLPVLLIGGGIVFVVVRKAKGGSSSEPAQPYTPPATGSSPQTGTAPASPAEPTSASKATEPVAVA